MSASRGPLDEGPTRRNFDQLYAGDHERCEQVLRRILPGSLSEPQLLELRSTAFLTTDSWIRLLDRTEAASRALGREESPLRLLDAGCGAGRVGRALASRSHASLVGADISISAIARAVSDQSAHGDSSFVVGDARSLPFRGASFQVIIALDVLHLIPDLAGLAKEFLRLLVPGGAVIGRGYLIGTSASQERSGELWKKAFRSVGFRNQYWRDETDEWREIMIAKHGERWKRRASLTRDFGAYGAAVCDVSRQMLGIGCPPGFIARNERWEFSMVTPS